MTRATRAVIDLNALSHNLEVSRRHASTARQVAVIKANGYGHGIVQVAQALQKADAFAVACIDEAISLREAGISKPILLLEGFMRESDLVLLQDHRLETVIHHPQQLDMLEVYQTASQAGSQSITVWLKIDTGMHRLGFAAETAADAFRQLQDCRCVSTVRLMTHLANADDTSDAFTTIQLERFHQAVGGIAAEQSIANSGGILGWPETHGDWVRPGIMLYGVSPFVGKTASDHGLLPVMTLESELIAVNHFSKGERVGYGGSWTCPEDMPVGVVAIGYGDGYPRHARSGTPVLLNGKRVPLIGRVSMDMICVDLRSQPDASPADKITLWGKGLAIEEVAQSADTIAYELLCKVTSRVSFDYTQR